MRSLVRRRSRIWVWLAAVASLFTLSPATHHGALAGERPQRPAIPPPSLSQTDQECEAGLSVVRRRIIVLGEAPEPQNLHPSVHLIQPDGSGRTIPDHSATHFPFSRLFDDGDRGLVRDLPPLELEDPNLKSFLVDFANFSAITHEDNAHFISMADRLLLAQRSGDLPEDSSEILWVDNEYAILKLSNDLLFKSKTIPNAVLNCFKQMLWQQILQTPVLSRNLLGRYVDFKSIRFAFKNVSAVGPAYAQAFRRAVGLTTTAIRLASALSPRYAPQPSSISTPELWFLSGTGFSPGEANAAGRFARMRARRPMPSHEPLPPLHFSEIAQDYTAILKEVDALRSLLEAKLGAESPALQQASEQLPQRIPSSDFVDILRSAKDQEPYTRLAYIRSRLANRLGVTITDETAWLALSYFRLIDLFAASVVQPQRVVISLSEAEHGIVSVDFAKQGAINAEEDMRTLAAYEPETAPSHVVQALRSSHDRSTELLKRKAQRFSRCVEAAVPRSMFQPPRFSGDDGIFLPKTPGFTDQQFQLIIEGLAGIHDGPRPAFKESTFRVVYIPSTIEPHLRSAHIVMLEELEKRLRVTLETQPDRRSGEIPYQDLQDLLIGFRLEIGPEGQKGIYVHLAGRFLTDKIISHVSETLKLMTPFPIWGVYSNRNNISLYPTIAR